MDPKLLLHFYQQLIVRALDAGDTDRLRRLIATRDDILDRLRLRDEPDDATRIDVLRQAAGELDETGSVAA